MVGTICPIGDGTRTVGTRILDSTCFLTGCVTSGAVLGLLLAAGGEFIVRPLTGDLTALGILGTVSLLALAIDRGVVKARISPFPRQVSALIFSKYRRPMAAARWGLEQGIGLLTHVNWAGFYVALAAAIVAGLPLGVVVLICYSLIRGVQPMAMLILAEMGNRDEGFFNEFSRAYPDFALLRTAALLSAAAVPLVIAYSEAG